MGSIAKKFVSRSLMLALFLSLGYLALPVSPAAQTYPQAVVLEQKLKETARVSEQRQKDEAWAQKQAIAQRRVAGEFAILLVKAKAQHAKMEQWQTAHSKELKAQAKGSVHKKRLECRLCF
jgi:hypothetical protein